MFDRRGSCASALSPIHFTPLLIPANFHFPQIYSPNWIYRFSTPKVNLTPEFVRSTLNWFALLHPQLVRCEASLSYPHRTCCSATPNCSCSSCGWYPLFPCFLFLRYVWFLCLLDFLFLRFPDLRRPPLIIVSDFHSPLLWWVGFLCSYFSLLSFTLILFVFMKFILLYL